MAKDGLFSGMEDYRPELVSTGGDGEYDKKSYQGLIKARTGTNVSAVWNLVRQGDLSLTQVDAVNGAMMLGTRFIDYACTNRLGRIREQEENLEAAQAALLAKPTAAGAALIAEAEAGADLDDDDDDDDDDDKTAGKAGRQARARERQRIRVLVVEARKKAEELRAVSLARIDELDGWAYADALAHNAPIREWQADSPVAERQYYIAARTRYMIIVEMDGEARDGIEQVDFTSLKDRLETGVSWADVLLDAGPFFSTALIIVEGSRAHDDKDDIHIENLVANTARNGQSGTGYARGGSRGWLGLGRRARESSAPADSGA